MTKKYGQGNNEERLEREDPNFHVVDASDATIQADRLHFDAQGAELQGRRFYKKMTEAGGKIK